MNISWKVVLAAIVAAFVVGCSSGAQAPQSTQPQVPSLKTSGDDLWDRWQWKTGRTVADLDEIAATYGVDEFAPTDTALKQRGFDGVGLLGKKCVVAFTDTGDQNPTTSYFVVGRYQSKGDPKPPHVYAAGLNDPPAAIRGVLDDLSRRIKC